MAACPFPNYPRNSYPLDNPKCLIRLNGRYSAAAVIRHLTQVWLFFDPEETVGACSSNGR